MSAIPCTVSILTRNSAATLPRALESVRDFAECIVCDGGSTDETLALARQAGARIITQDARFVDAEGRIVDYAGVRNQALELATQPWFLFLDSDEYLTEELVAEIARATQGEPKAFWLQRYYTWGGERIACSTTYPNRQMRLFHRETAARFIRRVHERIELLPGAVVETLPAYMAVPLDTTKEALWRKWDRYIALGEAGQPRPHLSTFIKVAWRHLKPSILFALRHIRMLVLCRGPRLPLWRELAEHQYNFKVVRGVWRRMRERTIV